MKPKALLVFYCCFFCGVGVSKQCRADATQRGFGDVAVFRAQLEGDGFVVREGLLNKSDPLMLFCNGILASGNAFNFDSPYCFYLMPELPEQATPPNGHNTYPWSFHMRADEAIVFVGWTPPPVKYFGYQSYISSRFHPVYKLSARFFINVGDAMNNFTIKSGDSPNGAPRSTPYDAATMIISTPDSGIAARVHQAALNAGCSESIINTEVISSQIVRFGLQDTCDQLTFLNRLAFFVDDPDHQIETAYFALDRPLVNPDGSLIAPPYGPNHRGWVFRITPAVPLEPDALRPFPMPHLRVRGTGDTREFNLLPALEKLRNALIATYCDPSTMEYEDVPTYMWIPDGFDQYQRQEYFTLGPTRDTIYMRSQMFQLSEDSSDFVIVYGLNHAMTGKSTYSSVVLYSEDPVEGIPAVADMGELVGLASINSEQGEGRGMLGSIQPFAPFIMDAVPDPAVDPQKFYVCKVTRYKKSEPYTIIVPDPPCPRLKVTQLLVGFRAYVEPETRVSPEWSEIVYDRVIHFRPRTTVAVAGGTAIPGRFALSQNYPNPGNSRTTVEYTVPTRCNAVLDIFNISGQMISRHTAVAEPAHINRFVVDGSHFASGVYFYRLQAGDQVAVKRMHWLR
ncbi:T9SS type A sorting domain-containing protein [candidate division KSB1 bacterium]|nr:T9SS type A sorting domain-containing protein [candidate division KSB1 bacterium]